MTERLDVQDALALLGGIASRADLLRLTTRHRLDTAVRAGDLVALRRGVYRGAVLDRDRTRAAQLRGVLSHLSAARQHGWELPPDDVCWVTVDRRRHALGPHSDVRLFYADLSGEDGPATSPVRTVLDCARRLPFPAALAVGDSALRHGVDRTALLAGAAAVRGKGASRARRVVAASSAAAANPFESGLRAIALDAGLDVLPQVPVGVRGGGGADDVVTPDLVDVGRRMVLEADSWEFHADKDSFQRDCWRYTVLAADGWLVLRFTWWQVMHHPAWVASVLRRVRTERGA